MKFRRITIFILFFIVFALSIYAENENVVISDSTTAQDESVELRKHNFCHFGYGGSAGMFYHFNREVDGTDLVKSSLGSFYSVSMNYRALEQDNSIYDMAYGLPTINFGVMFGYLSHIKMRGNPN